MSKVQLLPGATTCCLVTSDIGYHTHSSGVVIPCLDTVLRKTGYVHDWEEIDDSK